MHQAPGIQSGSNSSALGAALVALTPNVGPQPLRMPPSAAVFLRMQDLWVQRASIHLCYRQVTSLGSEHLFAK